MPCEAGEGCFACNPRQPTTCLICQNGYHQIDYLGECVKSNTNPLPKLDDVVFVNVSKLSRVLILSIILLWGNSIK